MIKKAPQSTDAWDVTCDKCDHHELVTGAETFRDVIKVIKTDLDFVVRPEGDHWEHICDSCIDDEKKLAAADEAKAVA